MHTLKSNICPITQYLQARPADADAATVPIIQRINNDDILPGFHKNSTAISNDNEIFANKRIAFPT